MERKRYGERDKCAGPQCGDQYGLGHCIEQEEENKDDEAGKRTLQQVALQVGLSQLAVEIQVFAPPGGRAKST